MSEGNKYWTQRFRDSAKNKELKGNQKTEAFRALGRELKNAKINSKSKIVMNRKQAEILLKEKFGHEKFYDEQWMTIERIFSGERMLLIEKTGFGKSLCFQFPALFVPGITVVFSPLIALMRDQANKMNKLGISAKCINSNQDNDTNKNIIAEARQNKIKILYIAPERMENVEWLENSKEMNISMIVIDEAHCISTWGHDFRPAYKRIIDLVNLLPKTFPVLAITATATKMVEQDIIQQMGNDVKSHRGRLIRDNFWLFVIKVKSEDDKFIWLAENLNKIEGSGLIYTGTRADTNLYSSWLNYLKIPTIHYNADLASDLRIEIETGLMNNKWKCVVSTNALGMGIDKPDIRFIIHTQTPISPIHYYQEIGRAGRDGKKTYLILFYNPDNDDDLPNAFIESAKPSIQKYQKVIDCLRKERLNERELIIKTNLKTGEVRTIKSDLIEQKIINQVVEGRIKKYEYRFNAPNLDVEPFIKLKEHKILEYEKMKQYIHSQDCRMKFLCNYLDDALESNCKKCDNDINHIVEVTNSEESKEKLASFKENNFPVLLFNIKNNNLTNGIAASYYGFSDVGSIIHKCKYQNGGDFPPKLIDLTLKALSKTVGDTSFDLILYVPPTESGELVKRFAEQIATLISTPISHNLKKRRKTKPQKIFQNSALKQENIKDVFIYSPSFDIQNKDILLIDDIFDSGATIKEIGKYLTSLGARTITPLVIAKTVGGDIKLDE